MSTEVNVEKARRIVQEGYEEGLRAEDIAERVLQVVDVNIELVEAITDFLGSCTETEGAYPPPDYEFDPKAWPEYTRLLEVLDNLEATLDYEAAADMANTILANLLFRSPDVIVLDLAAAELIVKAALGKNETT